MYDAEVRAELPMGPFEAHDCPEEDCDYFDLHELLVEQHWAREHAPTLEEIRRRAMRRV